MSATSGVAPSVRRYYNSDTGGYQDSPVAQKVASVGSGAASGAATGTSIAPGWGTAIGAVVGALISWYGMSKQEQANKSAQEYATGIDARDYAEGNRRYNTELNLKRQEIAYNKSQDAKKEKLAKENRDFEMANNLSNRILSIVNQKPELQQLLSKRAGQPKAKLMNPYDFKGLNPIGGAA
jgi:hypothetical protein